MARARVRISSAGAAEILKSAGVMAATKDAAEQVADNVRGQNITVGAMEGGGEMDLPVTVTVTTTDRAHANVTLAHPAGQAVQAKHGALTKAAAQAGLDVRAK
jgi:hypothetical protein